MTRLILAGTSRYRAALLRRLGIEFDTVPPHIDEAPYKQGGLDPAIIAESLALAKAEAVAQAHPEAIVIGADQTAACESRLLSKPGSFEAAREQLRFLSGKTHCLHSAIAVRQAQRAQSHVTTITLRVRDLSDAEIERYLRADEPYDCCGSYRLESLGISLFEAIDPLDETAVIGLPLLPLCRMLRSFGLMLP